MLILPAIDLYEGRAVRLYKGDYEQMTVYSGEPAAVALCAAYAREHLKGEVAELSVFASVNIIKNAYEAIDRNGRIRIVGEANPPSILIENNGPDIPDEVREKLFTPFFTTKPSGQGIGLMFVREVLNNHRLPFCLTSQDGSTQFRITFRLHDMNP